jgi:hypothetical protein
MPIRPEFRSLYPPDWPALSRHVRFEPAGGRCDIEYRMQIAHRSLHSSFFGPAMQHRIQFRRRV